MTTRYKLVIAVITTLALLSIGVYLQGRSGAPRNAASSTIGVILPLTGEAASYGEDCRRGLELAMESLPLPTRQTVKLVFEDSKADPKTAVSAFNKLANIDKVVAVVGDMFSSTTLAIAPLAQQAHILLLSPTAADEKIPATGDYVFSIYPPAPWEGKFMASRMEAAELENVVVLYQNQAAAVSIAESFAATVKARGGKVALMDSITEDKSGYRSLIDKTAAIHPSAIYISAYKDPVAQLVMLGREAGLNVRYVTQSSLFDEKVLADYSGKLEGVVLSGPFFDAASKQVAIADFSAKYQAKFGKPPSVWAAYGYDAVNMVVYALDRAQKEGGAPKDKLPNQVFNGLTGKTTIRADRSVDKEMIVYIVQNNRFVAK